MDRNQTAEVPAAELSARAEIQKEINDVYSTINENQAEYDKQLLTLSSGFLAVSLAFIKDIVPLHSAELLWILYLSFVSLALCIVSVLFSYQFSIAGLFKAKAYWDNMLAGKKDTKFPYTYADRIKVVNKASGILFLLGVSSLVIFVILNLGREATMPNKWSLTQDGSYIRVPPSGEKVEKGAHIKVPPSPAPTAPVPSAGTGRGDNNQSGKS
jgi:hypothetical protein